MREIKFRAWDKSEKKMIDSSEFIVWDLLCDFHESNFKDDNYIFIQYTGLKDKNGVEMYFEDIAKATFCCAVCFDNEPHELIGHIDQLDSGEWVLDYGHGSISLDALEDIEVIGNIHQHPELMEGK